MSAAGGAIGGPVPRRGLAGPGTLALLWLGGIDLRVTVLAVPPVIPAIHRDLPLDEKAIAILTGLPTLVLGLGSVAGALLIAWMGARRALIAGLLTITVASALRGVGPNLAVLFAMTALMGAGVAVSQPAFPTLTRQWFPLRIGLATAVYSNGLLVGETLPTGLTGPLVLPALGGSWPLSLALWSALPMLAAGLLLLLARDGAAASPGLAGPGEPERLPSRWWPDFRGGWTWRLGLMMGAFSAAYFGVNAFLPDFLRATARPELKDAALTALNACQLPASLLMLVLLRHILGRRWPYVACGLLTAAAALGVAFAPGAWVVVCAGVVGFAASLAFIVTLALPPLLAGATDVARFSAGIFFVQYLTSFAGPLLGGAAWDLSGFSVAAFATLAAGGLATVALAARLDLRRPGASARLGGVAR